MVLNNISFGIGTLDMCVLCGTACPCALPRSVVVLCRQNAACLGMCTVTACRLHLHLQSDVVDCLPVCFRCSGVGCGFGRVVPLSHEASSGTGASRQGGRRGPAVP